MISRAARFDARLERCGVGNVRADSIPARAETTLPDWIPFNADASIMRSCDRVRENGLRRTLQFVFRLLSPIEDIFHWVLITHVRADLVHERLPTQSSILR